MQLVLTVLRCPDTVAPESRTVSGGEFTVGRGPGVDWVLPDAERLLSKRHFALAYRGAAWQVADISTNGTFLNREDAPIGKDEIRALRDGDRLRLGSYEIEVRLSAPEHRAPTAPSIQGGFPLDDPFPASPAALPLDFDPLAADPIADEFRGATQEDHAPALSDAFAPPAPAGATLPPDWADSLLDGIGAPSAPKPQPAPAGPQPPAPRAVTPATAAEDTGLMAAFLEGAGLADVAVADPAARMRGLGAAFRALVAGVRAALIARASVKSEFRIEQTLIRARGNNPLKFAASDDDALASLLGAGRAADMTAEQAVADALKDIRLHELASMAAMQAAIRTLLDGLDPARLRAAAESGGGLSLLPAQRKARAWDAYEALHARTMGALSDDFDSVFGKAFARAYERALADISVRDGNV